MASDVTTDPERGGALQVLPGNVPPAGSMLRKRLTKVERAKLEALAAFGNCEFDSMVVKKDDFRVKLKATIKNAANKESTKRLTRMQKARQEANEAFKNVRLGQKRKANIEEKNSANAKKRLSRQQGCQHEAQNVPLRGESLEVPQEGKNDKVDTTNNEPKRPARISRVQTAKEEALKSFGGCSLDRIAKDRRKSGNKGRLSRNGKRLSSTRRGSLAARRRSSARVNQKRTTRVQAAQLEALQSFGGESLDKVWKSHEKEPPIITDETPRDHSCSNMEVDSIPGEETEGIKEPGCQPVGLSGILSNKGTAGADCKEEDNLVDSLEEDMATCEEVIEDQRNNEAGLIEKDVEQKYVERPCDDQLTGNASADTPLVQVKDASVGVSPDQAREHHVSSMHMSPIPEQSCDDTAGQSDSPSTPTQSSSSKHLTRLEKARLETLKSFHGQAFDHVIKTSSRKMAKYLTPVKHQGTNTEIHTKTTPSQTEDAYYGRPPRPNQSWFSNLGDKSFCDRGALLETSKMVVMTARTLNTPSPDCSPANSQNL